MAIDTVPPLIAAQISYLTSHCPFPVKVEKMWSGSKIPSLLDRFTLVIPFCLDFIKWDVIYNAVYPLAAPDIIFGPEDEMFQPYSGATGKSSKNSLADWNSKDPSRLLSLVIELRNEYMAYQRKRIGEVNDERLKFEISTMLPREGIEMYMSSVTDKPGEARFAIPLLDMDLTKLVAGSTWRQPQKIYLQVSSVKIIKKQRGLVRGYSQKRNNTAFSGKPIAIGDTWARQHALINQSTFRLATSNGHNIPSFGFVRGFASNTTVKQTKRITATKRNIDC